MAQTHSRGKKSFYGAQEMLIEDRPIISEQNIG